MQPPYDPHGQPPVPHRQPGPPPYGQPPPPYGYYPQQHGQIVSTSKLSSGAHVLHGIMTVLSCGLWSPIWIIHTAIAHRRTVTRY